VKITKLGAIGWTRIVPIEFDATQEDGGLPGPTISWNGPDTITIRVVSKVVQGTLRDRQLGLTVIREYVAA
jgi:hypothetical protein